MNQHSQILKGFASSGSMFFTLPDGEEAIVRYLSAEIVPNAFDGGKTTLVRYHIEKEGIKLMWDRPSRKLAEQMSEIPEGTLISIKRKGQKSQTKYIMKKVAE